MATKTKHKPMSDRQKKERATIRKDLRARGMIPPTKKPLNRKKYIQEAEQDVDKTLDGIAYGHYMSIGISLVLAWNHDHPTLEGVGIAKAMKIACEVKRLLAEKGEGGSCTYDEIFDRAKPILNA